MPTGTEKADIGVLFQAYHAKVCRYVLHLVGNPADAEDLTQETFLRAYRSQESLREPKAIRGWLYQIATRVCLDRLRQRKFSVSTESREATPRLESAAAQPSNAEELIERKETSACVQRCLDFLPDSYRAVILLYEGHSLKAQEIAQLLGVSVGTVKIRLHRARRKLQQVMARGCCVSEDRQGMPTCRPKS